MALSVNPNGELGESLKSDQECCWLQARRILLPRKLPMFVII